MRLNAPLDPIAGPVVRVTNVLDVHSQVCLVSFDYMTTGTPAIDTPGLLAIGNAWQTTLGPDFLACMSSDAFWRGFRVARLDSAVTPTAERTFAVAGFGAVAFPPLSTELAVILTRYTSIRGQHGRGRVLMPGIPNSFVTPATDPNRVNAGGLTAYNTFAVTMRTAMTVGANNWVPVISTRPIAPANVVTRANQVTSVVTRSIIGTCRRRREGRGI